MVTTEKISQTLKNKPARRSDSIPNYTLKQPVIWNHKHHYNPTEPFSYPMLKCNNNPSTNTLIKSKSDPNYFRPMSKIFEKLIFTQIDKHGFKKFQSTNYQLLTSFTAILLAE